MLAPALLIAVASEACEADFVALLIRGDHQLNEVKAEHLPEIVSPLQFATEENIRSIMNAGTGSLGPVNLTNGFCFFNVGGVMTTVAENNVVFAGFCQYMKFV
jgi:hypothetical protein